MDVSTLCLVLQGCLSPDLTTRKHAEQELSKIQHTNGNLPNLLRVAVEESLGTTLRQVAAIQIKNIVKRGWDPSGACSVLWLVALQGMLHTAVCYRRGQSNSSSRQTSTARQPT
ncbi:hypothetical protein ABBQ38_15508 [Trebouxia sp. C0009 RCD-2024]